MLTQRQEFPIPNSSPPLAVLHAVKSSNKVPKTTNYKVIVLYCTEGVVIAAQCTAAFLRSIVLSRIQVLLGREYAD